MPPVVTTNPANQAVNVGLPVTFTAAATDTTTPTVQWQVSTNNGASFSNIAGATSTSYTVTTTAAMSGYRYQAVFTDFAGLTATTTAATLTVNTAPVVSSNPANATAIVGASASFTAAASGTPAPTVQWQVSTDGTNWSNVSGATSTTYTFTAALAMSGNQYRAVFTNSVGSVTSTAARLTALTVPVVTASPASKSVVAGVSVAFTASAAGATSTQWQVSVKGGAYSNITGATSTTYTVTSAASLSGNMYRAVFSNASGSVATSGATLTILVAPVVTVNPASKSVAAGTSTSLTAAASGSPAPTVQWQVAAKGSTTWNNIAGATSTTYAFTATATQSGSQYRAIFTNAAGAVSTTVATLAVLSSPVITINPVSQTVTPGKIVSFTAAAAGSPTPLVQWQMSTNGITWINISGATSTTYNVLASSSITGRMYRARFTSSLGSATTAAATLNVSVTAAIRVTSVAAAAVTNLDTAVGSPVNTTLNAAAVNAYMIRLA